MRAHADAVAVGVSTVLADDPLLSVRLPGLEDRSPIRVVLDSRLRTPVTSRLSQGASEIPTWIVTTADAPADRERALVRLGVEVMRVGADEAGRVRLPEALRLLGTRGLTRLFCEGGPELADALARADLVDEVALVTASGTIREGDLPALLPGIVETLRRFRSAGEEHLGEDRLTWFERN
jgi:diaminohydroxyphosphoribosylaminopyrimidine deaminase/5-amino-6-(5-phosphoribosylamino)uracil reductase